MLSTKLGCQFTNFISGSKVEVPVSFLWVIDADLQSWKDYTSSEPMTADALEAQRMSWVMQPPKSERCKRYTFSSVLINSWRLIRAALTVLKGGIGIIPTTSFALSAHPLSWALKRYCPFRTKTAVFARVN
jgi:hypothetical protein